MRQIKFRGKANGRWIYGGLVYSDNIEPAIYFEVGNKVKRMEWAYVDPATVGQFTGLTDKHGCEIYEGDIIKWLRVSHATRNVIEPPEDYIEECMDVVVFGAGAFTIEEEMYPDMALICKEGHYNETDLFTWVYNLDDFPGITTDDMYICEVVGNIHDNPEMLEKGGQDEQANGCNP